MIIAIIPAFNESKKIGYTVDQVAKYVDKVVVVDDGSSDNTVEILRGKKIAVLCHIVNLGQGAALQTGFEYAKKIGASVVVTYDADGQFQPQEIKRVIAPILEGRVQVVLGSRFIGKTVNIPFGRWIVLKLGIFFTYLFTNLRLTDTHNGFRAFNRFAFRKMNIIHNRWAHPSDILYQINVHKLKFIEVPVTVRYTSYSRSKGQKTSEAFRIPFDLITKALIRV